MDVMLPASVPDLNTVIDTISTELSLGSSTEELRRSTNGELAPCYHEDQWTKAILDHLVRYYGSGRPQLRPMCLQSTPFKTIHGNVETCTIPETDKKSITAVPRDKDRGRSSSLSEAMLKVQDAGEVHAPSGKPRSQERIMKATQVHVKNN